MSTEIVLEYKRTGESYNGTLRVDDYRLDFTDHTFAQMMREVHLSLTACPDATVVLQRTERAGLMQVHLEPAAIALLRDDPAKYIQAHTIAHRVVDLTSAKVNRKSKLATKYVVPKSTAIRAGHETLAAAFGDMTYLSLRNGRVEHPVTGRWCTTHAIEVDLGIPIVEAIAPVAAGTGWVTVRTAALLANTSAQGYFLPRAWNEKGPWISREALQKKYDEYLKERNSCLATAATTQ